FQPAASASRSIKALFGATRSNSKKSATHKQTGAAEASSIMGGQVSLRAAPLIALRPLFFDFVSDLLPSSTACPIRRSIPRSSAFLHRALRRPIHWRELVTLPAVY